ncbi:FMN-binding negative transcriptional regulator [Leptothrix cholodnii SP-6]|uniref:FMN-binding negative transcriptional regulator n=1 Tax=Leptothrix cholodnii (strain ATCC 51168 / LMG 8142 / SP-6) TaxID=395495 RepID=B1Y0A9_LEPCP|nr:FMN-binding negative transcriptional regulator [Leptothrix cholodnii]ACB36588.1 FMN-binding negative transcriptional regulator [Leptothrix cholodnii SP-6]
MYVNPQHPFTDPEAVYSLMASHPLGAWVCHGQHGLIANHLPFFLDRSRGPHGTLIGHVSRANTVWRELGPARPSVVMFQGPQAYITPGWYPGKAEHGKVVPTWNYVVAHAHGVARAIDDRGWLLDMLNRLADVHEAGRPAPWRVGDAPASFIDKLLRAIVGIEIPIDRLEGKLKVSQDEAMPDRLGTVRGLQEQASDEAGLMADLVMQAIKADAAG